MHTVEQLQTALADLGFYTGDVDGVQGDVTTQAMQAFQRANGLPDNGKYSEALAGLLFLPAMPDRADAKAQKPIRTRWPHDDSDSLLNFYGEPGEDNVMLKLPYSFRLAWDLNTTVDRVMVHDKCKDAWAEIFERTLQTYGLKTLQELRLHYFGGGMAQRAIRGGSRLSTHNWCAMDFDPARNGLNTKWRDAAFSHPDYQEFWEIVESVGGVSLGKTRNYDAMHIQFAWR